MTASKTTARRVSRAAKPAQEVFSMNVKSIALPTGGVPFVDKVTLVETGQHFVVTATAPDSYKGNPQHRLTIIDTDGDTAYLTLGGGGSRDTAVAAIAAALAEPDTEAVGPFQLVSFVTGQGVGYALANV